MKKKYVPSPECFTAADAAAKGKLTEDEINEAFERIADHKRRLQQTGEADRMADRLTDFARREAERTRIAAAMQKRHAALNALVRDRLDQTLESLQKAGLPPYKALLAVMEGTQRGVEGGRNSVGALQLAYESRYIGAMFSDFQREIPHWQSVLGDAKFDADLLREMGELGEGGRPGRTGNADAVKAARIFSKYTELSRTDLNRLGASIGKLDGWAGAQTHDDVRMIAAGKDAWVNFTLSQLDLERTFPDAGADEVRDILGDVYDTITTGVPNKATPREKGQRVNPASLARSLGKSRVLHFASPEAALAYRERFGFGNSVSGMAAHLRRSARMAAMMETFGPNPELMYGSIVESMQRKIKESDMSPAEKDKALKPLQNKDGSLRAAFDVMSGIATKPGNATAADIGADIRAVQSMAKLGGAVISSIPSDTITNAIASQFRGSGFFNGLVNQIDGIMRGRPKAEQAEISYLFGEGFDGLIGRIVNPAAAVDGPVGRMSRLKETFFKLNGLNWWTDVSRASAARTIAAEMGMRSKTAWDDLPRNYQHVLGLHNITADKWDVIRKAGTREVNGRDYITPDMIRNLDDEAIIPLVQDRLDTDSPELRDKMIEDARRGLEMDVLRFVADEVNYGVIENDAASRRIATLNGLRPGTMGGEACRFVMQFKGFPLAFTQRVLGRAILGQRADASALQKAAHIGTVLAGMAMAGYMAMIMKDIAKGYWPPRDPSDPKVWIAALQQGGALGIYGDFLFGEANRFDGGPLETLAGPTIGSGGDLVKLILKIREGTIDPEKDVKAADFLSFAVNNTPGANLFYVRPALDFLFLNSLRETLSPGYLKRQEKRRIKDYGQRSYVPRRLEDAL